MCSVAEPSTFEAASSYSLTIAPRRWRSLCAKRRMHPSAHHMSSACNLAPESGNVGDDPGACVDFAPWQRHELRMTTIPTDSCGTFGHFSTAMDHSILCERICSDKLTSTFALFSCTSGLTSPVKIARSLLFLQKECLRNLTNLPRTCQNLQNLTLKSAKSDKI